MPATIETLALHTDQRGLLFEPLGPDELPHQLNAHVALTEPGGVRGNHFHERGTEIATVLGPALVRIGRDGAVFDSVVPENEAWRFTIPPRASHAFQNIGERPMLLVVFNTQPHDPADPDVVRDVLIES